MKKIKYIKGVELPVKKLCDRCGNDLANGTAWLHLPFRKKYVVLCLICNYGLMYGFYKDVKKELKDG